MKLNDIKVGSLCSLPNCYPLYAITNDGKYKLYKATSNSETFMVIKKQLPEHGSNMAVVDIVYKDKLARVFANITLDSPFTILK